MRASDASLDCLLENFSTVHFEMAEMSRFSILRHPGCNQFDQVGDRGNIGRFIENCVKAETEHWVTCQVQNLRGFADLGFGGPGIVVIAVSNTAEMTFYLYEREFLCLEI